MRPNDVPISLLRRIRRRFARAFVADVEIHGRHSRDWMEAISPLAPIWHRLADVARPSTGASSRWRKRVVVPLMERHILSMPHECHALVPSAEAVAILSDKARFADYVDARGLGHLVPARLSLSAPAFPAMLKRTTLNSGRGITVVHSPAELTQRLAEPQWAGHPVLLQELIAAHADLATYVVCVDGRIEWHCSYSYPLDHDERVRGPVTDQKMRRFKAPAADLKAFEQVLGPLRYNGPAAIDYRRRADGSIAILEINPRLGGSLMRRDTHKDLARAIATIVEHARWRSAPQAERVHASQTGL